MSWWNETHVHFKLNFILNVQGWQTDRQTEGTDSKRHRHGQTAAYTGADWPSSITWREKLMSRDKHMLPQKQDLCYTSPWQPVFTYQHGCEIIVTLHHHDNHSLLLTMETEAMLHFTVATILYMLPWKPMNCYTSPWQPYITYHQGNSSTHNLHHGESFFKYYHGNGSMVTPHHDNHFSHVTMETEALIHFTMATVVMWYISICI